MGFVDDIDVIDRASARRQTELRSNYCCAFRLWRESSISTIYNITGELLLLSPPDNKRGGTRSIFAGRCEMLWTYCWVSSGRLQRIGEHLAAGIRDGHRRHVNRRGSVRLVSK